MLWIAVSLVVSLNGALFPESGHNLCQNGTGLSKMYFFLSAGKVNSIL